MVVPRNSVTIRTLYLELKNGIFTVRAACWPFSQLPDVNGNLLLIKSPIYIGYSFESVSFSNTLDENLQILIKVNYCNSSDANRQMLIQISCLLGHMLKQDSC